MDRLSSARVARVAALAAAAVALALPQPTSASALSFSYMPSRTEPYAVCGRPTAGHSACAAIIVPTAVKRSLSVSGQTSSPSLSSPAYTGSGIGGGFDPADLRSAYNLPSESAGSGQTVAIVDAFDDPDAESDLGVYRAHYGLPACTTANGCFKKVNEQGETNNYPPGEPGWAVEISLDTDMVSAACPNCHILLVEAESNENAALYKAEDEAATLGATEISNSYESKEVSSETSSDVYFDHPGVPIFAAAGDGSYGVRYPAASQYVTAVGGTALTQASNSRGWSETVWDETGSGCSAYEPKPAWQSASPKCTKRTNNDIAAVASTETPVSVADSYKLPEEYERPEPGWTLAGGTSVSTPLMAGTMALANAYTRSLAGADAYYQEAYQNGTGVLTDVTSGSNGSCGNYLCTGEVGYDGPTGLGSPSGAPIVAEAPTVLTKPASSIAPTTATLNATVNPNGDEVTRCEFEYGTTSSYGLSAPCSALPGSGSSPVAVSAPVTGLSANGTYHFRIVAINSSGIRKGSDETLKTTEAAKTPPTVVSTPAAAIDQTIATLNATVNPNSSEASRCEFEYGTTSSYGESASCSALPGAGSSPVAVSAVVSSLSADTTYHFRISATNANGTSVGSDETFKTLQSCAPEGFCASITPANIEGSLKEPDAVATDSSGDIFVGDSGHDRVLEFNPKREYLRQFGSAGSGQGQFQGIAGIAVNASGDVYVSSSDRIQEFSPTGAYVRQFGSAGSGDGQFAGPSAIAIDEGGDVWVLDTFNYRIQEFSASGTYLGQFGTPGSGNGQLGWAFGLAFSGGNLYVSEFANARVQEFSTAGTYLGQFGTAGSGNGQFRGPWGIASDPNSGNLYVSDTVNSRIEEFSASGAFITAFGTAGSGQGQLSDAQGVAVGPSGTLYVSDTAGNRIEEWAAPKGSEPPAYSTSITPANIEGSLKEPDAVATDSSGDIFVGDSGHDRVLEFNPKREYLRQFGSAGSGQGQFQGIAGIAVNASGDVYVSSSDRIQEFSPTGAYVRQFGSAGSGDGQFAGPSAIAIDEGGDVWVLDTFNYRIQEFSASGTYLGQFGTPGSGNGQLGWAFGLAFSGGNLYVSEFANARVQEFSTAGTYLGQFGSAGSGNGQFRGPWGIASDPNSGNLYVSDTVNSRIEEFSASGAFITAFGTAGSGQGQLSDAQGVAVNSSGNVFTADAGNGRIEEWAP